VLDLHDYLTLFLLLSHLLFLEAVLGLLDEFILLGELVRFKVEVLEEGIALLLLLLELVLVLLQLILQLLPHFLLLLYFRFHFHILFVEVGLIFSLLVLNFLHSHAEFIVSYLKVAPIADLVDTRIIFGEPLHDAPTLLADSLATPPAMVPALSAHLLEDVPREFFRAGVALVGLLELAILLIFHLKILRKSLQPLFRLQSFCCGWLEVW